MTKELENKIIPFEKTCLIKVDDNNHTLPVDTAAELTKGLQWINKLCAEVLSERYVEEIEDRNGNLRTRTNFHPLTPKLLQEQRKRIDQIYKILGGETVNEIKKEMGKQMAKVIFQTSKDSEVKENYKKQAIKVIEEGLHDDEEN